MRFLFIAALAAALPIAASAQEGACEALRQMAGAFASTGVTVIEANEGIALAITMDRLDRGPSPRMDDAMARSQDVARETRAGLEAAITIVERSGC